MHAAIDHLAWPFFDDTHRALATSVTEWTNAQGAEPLASSEAEVDDACRAWVRRLGDAGFLLGMFLLWGAFGTLTITGDIELSIRFPGAITFAGVPIAHPWSV